MASLTAAQLSPMLNGYSISRSHPQTITVPNASRLATLQDVTVTGTLLKKQFLKINPPANRPPATLAANGGAYVRQSGDGDLHFCLGTKQLRPHIACELQNARAWIATFNQAIGQKIAVSGFFRCLFEHPGFRSNDDAHIFEIHPVRAVTLGGQVQAFDVDAPEPASIHTWNDPHPLNEQDDRIKVRYDKASDTLTFTGMDGQDENYVEVSGTVSKVRLNAASATPAQFTFDSPDIGHPVQAYCLQGTSAARQLRELASTNITMTALRNIDLAQALKNRYTINLLVIDIQSA